MLSVTSTWPTKELTHSSCFVDVMRSHESCVHLSALVTLEWVQELAFVWNLSAILMPQHTAPLGSCRKKEPPMTGGMCPSSSGGHSISCIPIGTIISSDTVSAGNVVHHDCHLRPRVHHLLGNTSLRFPAAAASTSWPAESLQ